MLVHVGVYAIAGILSLLSPMGCRLANALIGVRCAVPGVLLGLAGGLCGTVHGFVSLARNLIGGLVSAWFNRHGSVLYLDV